MHNLNNITTLQGHLTYVSDLEKTLAGIFRLRLHVETQYQNKGFEKSDTHQVVLHGDLAEACYRRFENQALRPKAIHVKGELKVSKITNEHGSNEYLTQVHAFDIRALKDGRKLLFANQVVLIGRIDGPVNIRQISDAHKVSSFKFVTTGHANDFTQAKQYHYVSAWNALSTKLKVDSEKNSGFHFIGRLNNKTWVDKDSGEEQTRSEINLMSYQLVDIDELEETDANPETSHFHDDDLIRSA